MTALPAVAAIDSVTERGGPLKQGAPASDTPRAMWVIPFMLAAMLLVPAALFAACTAHDAATDQPERLWSAKGAVRQRGN